MTQGILQRNLIAKYAYKFQNPFKLHPENPMGRTTKLPSALPKTLVHHVRNKDVEIDCHFIRENG